MLKQLQTEEILRLTRTGIWQVEMEQGSRPRFYANDIMDEMLGVKTPLTPEERYEFHRCRIHPDDREIFQEYVNEMKYSNTEVIYRYLHPERGEMIIRCSGRKEASVPGVVRMAGIHKDITETVRLEPRKMTERYFAERALALQKENSRQAGYYRELLDAQNCGLLVYSVPEHKIIHMNAEALRIYGGASVEEMQGRIGEMFAGMYYPDPKTLKRLIRLRHEDGVVDFEGIVNHGTPGECHIMAKTKIIRLLDDTRAVMTTFLDVSDMVTLRRALKQAQDGSRAKTEFLSRMSHDIRTPLNGIIGLLEIDKNHPDDHALVNANRDKMFVAARHLLSLINDVLQMSKLESGEIVLAHEAFSLRQLFPEIITIVEGRAAGFSISMEYDLPTAEQCDCCCVYGSPLHLRQLLLNIYTNCIKYNRPGGKVYTKVERVKKTEEQVVYRWTITDTGIGMSDHFVKHIFDPFVQEHSDARSVYQGTGLGMTIVKKLVDKMHGSIEVSSREGVGSTFVITLPFEIAQQQKCRGENTSEKLSIQGLKLMLAEDNELNAEIAQVLLQDAGAEITVVNDGRQALELFAASPVGTFDGILMDVMMPVMDGLAAARAIRALPRKDAQQVPIIAMTANAFVEDAQKSMQAGMNAHLAKPLDIHKTIAVIAACCR